MENQIFNIWSNHTNNLGFESIEQIYSKIKEGNYRKVIEIIRKSNNNELKNQVKNIFIEIFPNFRPFFFCE